MMVALGVCTSANPHEGGLGYMAGMFHLFTHAMFKALLFLGAGCIIHAVHSNEMSTMGGLRKYMPITHITFLIACLAIAGIPPFSGFFSKDEILTACFQFSPVMGWIMTIIAGMTAFYMFRLYYGIFWGTENKEFHAEHVPHESPLAMTFPLMCLAAITIVCGWLLPFGHFVSANGEAYDIHLDTQVAATSIIVAIIAIAIATWMYARDRQPVADMLATRFSTLHRAAYKRFYMDEIWLFITKRIIFRCVPLRLPGLTATCRSVHELHGLGCQRNRRKRTAHAKRKDPELHHVVPGWNYSINCHVISIMNILSLFVIIPLLMLLGLWIARNVNQIRGVMVTGSSLLLILAAYLAVSYIGLRNEGATAEMLFTDSVVWYAPLHICYSVGVDGISVVMLLLSSIIVFTGTFAILETQAPDKKNIFCGSPC